MFIQFLSSANYAFLLMTFCLIELSSCPLDVSLRIFFGGVYSTQSLSLLLLLLVVYYLLLITCCSCYYCSCLLVGFFLNLSLVYLERGVLNRLDLLARGGCGSRRQLLLIFSLTLFHLFLLSSYSLEVYIDTATLICLWCNFFTLYFLSFSLSCQSCSSLSKLNNWLNYSFNDNFFLSVNI